MVKRFLTQREAEKCEQAQEPVCKCRCQGAKHGAGRIPQGGDFSLLPEDDPHYRPSMSPKQAQRFLTDAMLKFSFPRLADREQMIAEDRFDEWLEINKLEHKIAAQTADILRQAKESLRTP